MKIGEAARILGTTPAQLRQWEASGELLPARKTRGGTRYYATSDLLDHQVSVAGPLTVCYATWQCKLSDQPEHQHTR